MQVAGHKMGLRGLAIASWVFLILALRERQFCNVAR